MGEGDIPIPEIIEHFEAERMLTCIEGNIKQWRENASDPTIELSKIRYLMNSHFQEIKGV